MTDTRRAARARVLESSGARPPVVDELLDYGDQPATATPVLAPPDCPLSDEPHIENWLAYERAAREAGAFEVLRQHFVQLRFPIRGGISGEDAYGQATRHGDFTAAETEEPSLALSEPNRLELTVPQTMAGRIPVLVAGNRQDFVTLVQAFTERNEPVPVPDAMGACIVRGLNNWSRIAAYRRAWELAHGGPDDAAWAEEFRSLIPRKALYQDRLVILSRGPYSAIDAAAVAQTAGDWLTRSLVIRREHELTHYFVYRVFGYMRSHVFDELIADFVGLIRAFGQYSAAMALRFLGLERYPEWRAGGRLEVYRGQPRLSDDAFAVVRTLAVRSAGQLDALAARHRDALTDLPALGRLTFALSGLALEDLASPDLPDLVSRRVS